MPTDSKLEQHEASEEAAAETSIVERAKGELVKKVLGKKELQELRIKSLENEIHEVAMDTVRDSLRFADLDPGNPDYYPQHWVDECGGDMEQVERRRRVARSAWMSAKEAPVALAIAKSIAVGISKARAAEGGGDKTLNVNIVQMPMAPKQYEIIDMSDDEVDPNKRGR